MAQPNFVPSDRSLRRCHRSLLAEKKMFEYGHRLPEQGTVCPSRAPSARTGHRLHVLLLFRAVSCARQSIAVHARTSCNAIVNAHTRLRRSVSTHVRALAHMHTSMRAQHATHLALHTRACLRAQGVRQNENKRHVAYMQPRGRDCTHLLPTARTGAPRLAKGPNYN